MIRSIILFYKRVFRVSVFGLLLLSMISACLSSVIETDPEDDGTPSTTVVKLNKNVIGLRGLANACLKADSVAVFSIEYNEDQSALYWLSMKEGGDIELFSEIVAEDIRVPELSMEWVRDAFYWTIDGVLLLDRNGHEVCVTDLTKPLSFYSQGKSFFCRIQDSIVSEYPFTRADYLAKDISVNYDTETRGFSVHLSSGYETTLPTIQEFHLVDIEEQNRSFYKDIFLDAGVGLTSRKSLAAAKYLGLSLEGVSQNNKTTQTNAISGDSNDLNGRLLYPDGQPRYRLLFVNGGDSRVHGQSLGKKGLENMRSFVRNGGCYVGTCAGAFLASNGFDGRSDYPNYLSIWPGMMNHTGLSQTYSGMFIEKDSPLLQYYGFGGDHYVDSVRHNSGGYPVEFPLRTEILGRYDYPKKGTVHRKPSIWAYKETLRTGRVVLEGSHPEEVKDGERRDLTAAMIRYAMDGVGLVSLKGFLKNGVERVMDKTTDDNKPAYTRIGDLQTHHFAAYIPSDAHNIRVELSSASDCDLALMMNQGTYAFSDVAEYRSSASGAQQHLFFSSIREGLWFIGVQCLTTVTVKETDYGQDYGGNLEVLNGIPYRISISWE